MTDRPQINNRKFARGFMPRYSVVRRALLWGLVPVLAFGLFTQSFAQFSAAQKKIIDVYISANVYKYYGDMKPVDMLECKTIAVMRKQMVNNEKSLSGEKLSEFNRTSDDIINTLSKVLTRAGYSNEEQIAKLIEDAKISQVLYGKDISKVKIPSWLPGAVREQAAVCDSEDKEAFDKIGDFMAHNYDIVFAPPPDNPYRVDPGNESLIGLFKSIVEYSPANERISAQRCYMIPSYAFTTVYGLGDEVAPALDSAKFGYSHYEAFERDMNRIETYFGAVLKAMPDNPETNYTAKAESENEVRAIVTTGTHSQIDMFAKAVYKAMPDCVARAKAGLRKKGTKK